MTRFTTDIQMRFRDIDGMGHVNNAVYLSYTELARTQFYMKHGRKKTLEDIDFILAHVDIDFESQAVHIRGWTRANGALAYERDGPRFRLLRVPHRTDQGGNVGILLIDD